MKVAVVTVQGKGTELSFTGKGRHRMFTLCFDFNVSYEFRVLVTKKAEVR